MSPQKQAAQIANAQKSHGATTEAGRARSSQNSIRHSLCSKKYFIVPEDRPEFDIYYNDLLAALAPEGAAESLLAEAIIMDEWRLTRARQAENQIFCRAHMSLKPEEPFSSAETWLAHSKELATLTLYEQRINRVLSRNKAEFESRQAARQASGADLLVCALPTTQSQSPEAIPAAAEPDELKTEIAAPEQPVGFVHSSATASPTAEPQPLTPAAKQPAGFVRSSADANGGFVHSNGSAAGSEESLARPIEPAAESQPVSTPPTAARRAA
jgi:hypothetical protein